MLTLASLFDGIAGFPLAGSRHRITPVWASEIEKFPAAVSAFHFPDMVQHGDVTKIDGATVEPVDIITFGSPCQDLSVAGKRAGLKHDDIEDDDDESEGTRSGLFMEAVRIIKEMRNATRATGNVQPRYAVWENVPGAFSSNQGKDFHTVLSELAGCADGKVSVPRCPNDEWEPNGCILGDQFSLAWRTLDAQYWGVPQRRNRIYLVCDFGGQSAPEVLFKQEGLSGDIEKGRETGQRVAGDAEGCAGTAVGCGSVLSTNTKRDSDSTGQVRCNKQEVHERLMCAGFKGNQGSLAGSIGYEVEVAPTILAGQEGHVMFSCGGFSNYHEDDKAATQRASIAKHSDVDLVIIPINDQATHENGHCNGSMVGVPGDPMYSLTVQDRHAVMVENHPADSRVKLDETGICQTLTSRMGTGGGNVPMLMAHGQANAEVVEDGCPALTCNHEQPILFPREAMRVRRLTPLECERLQGYQDGWTDIPGASDSGRYKALGNSLAIPCAEFVMAGIAETANQ